MVITSHFVFVYEVNATVILCSSVCRFGVVGKNILSLCSLLRHSSSITGARHKVSQTHYTYVVQQNLFAYYDTEGSLQSKFCIGHKNLHP